MKTSERAQKYRVTVTAIAPDGRHLEGSCLYFSTEAEARRCVAWINNNRNRILREIAPDTHEMKHR